jgi:hypothetical protein
VTAPQHSKPGPVFEHPSKPGPVLELPSKAAPAKPTPAKPTPAMGVVLVAEVQEDRIRLAHALVAMDDVRQVRLQTCVSHAAALQRLPLQGAEP